MNTELAISNQSKPSALLTIDPESYVTEVFNPFRAELEILKAEAETVKYDIATTAGMKVAVEHRAKFRDMRINAEKARKERKAPILEIGKLLDSRYKEIEAEITPFENRFDSDIKQEEARKEAERQAKIAAERARIDAIKALIAAIRDLPLHAIGKSAVEISTMIGNLVAAPMDDRYQEFIDEAKAVRLEVLDKLAKAETAQRGIETEAESQRQEAARIAAEREELAKLRAAQELKAKAEREAADAELKAARDRMNTEAEALRLEREEIARQKEEMEAAQRAHERQLIDESGDAIAQQKALNDARELDAVLEDAFISTFADAAPISQMLKSAPSTPPTLTLGKIGARLGFSLTADFLRSIGFEPAGKERAAVLYHESSFPLICDALIDRVQKAKTGLQQAA